ncbi:MAG TPA: secondary thiamine-phosphate synthase enzyme YjbQ, partial [Candidatus Polarisedimenticolia bacterium]|nr:secondary thiamine-phosphate synthase enzyme YjbQ [Candidatus Polarisedimenticolia bacterium]
MRQHLDQFTIRTARGLTDVTAQVRRIVAASGIRRGLCTVTIRHTSASLVIQENADPKVLSDLEAFLTRLVPDGDPLFTHND